MYIPVLDGTFFHQAVGKCVCVGRNYAAHAQELNNPIPSAPILFIKPADAVVGLTPSFVIPTDCGEVHHELEIAVLIASKLQHANAEQVEQGIAGIGLGLDLTLRDVQSELKAKGQPWELAKAFDGSCPLGHFISLETSKTLTQIDIGLTINSELKQQGNSRDMLFPIVELIAHISRFFTLNPGDVVLTGTPAGVGPLKVNDHLTLRMGDHYLLETTVKD